MVAAREVTQAEVENRSNRMMNYVVFVNNIYGLKKMKSKMKLHVGMGSANHWETMDVFVKGHYGRQAKVYRIEEAAGTFGFGVGTPQSTQDD